MLKIKNSLLFIFVSFSSFNLIAQSNSHYEKALQSYIEQDYNESYIHLKNALKDNPSDLAAKILMGEMLLINGYFAESVTELEEALDFGADPNLVLKSYSKSLILTQKFSDILLLEFNNLNDDNKFELNLLRATAYASLGDIPNAEKSYLLASALKPNNVRTLNSLVTLYLKQNNLAESNRFLDTSLKINDKHASTWRLKGLLQKQQKQTAEALISFEKAYKLNPDDPFVLRAYADGLWQAKKISKAETILNTILAQTPDDPYAILLQSQILSVSNRTKQAQELLGKLAQDLTLLDAQNVASNISLRFASGMTAYLTNNYEQALSDMIYYINNSSLEINTLGVLADTYIKLKKERSALKLLEANEELVIKNLSISLLLCDLYLKTNRAFKCETLSNILKEKYPNQPKVDFVKAKTLVARGKINEAIQLLSSITAPKFNHQKQLAIAHLYFQTENFSESHIIAKSLLSELPTDIDILNLNVALLIKKQDWQPAQKLIDTILSIQANYVPTLYNQANLLGAQKKFTQALDIMKKLENDNSLQAGSYLLYSDLLTSTEDYDSAIEKLRHASKLDKQSIPISEKLIGLYIQTERYKEALWEIDTYTKKTLADEKYILIKAELMHKLGRVEESKKLLATQFTKWKTQPNKLIQLSRTQLKVKNYSGVEQTLLSILSLQQNKYLPALLQLSNLYSDTNKFQLTQKYLTIANDHYPKNPAVLVAQAKLDIQMNKSKEAVKLLWKVLSINKEYFPAYGQLYQLSNKGIGTDKFVENLEAILKTTPDKHLLRNLLADTYLQNNYRDKASIHYQLLADLKEYANAASILNNLAFIAIDKDINQAMTLVEKGLKLTPKSASLIDTKGWITAHQGQFNKALELLRQAYSMESNDPSIRYHLAFTLNKLGRIEEAKRELDQAFKLNIPFNESSDAKKLQSSL